jgi:chromosome segregation ATPase
MPVWGRRRAEVEVLTTELAEQIERTGRAEADREALRATCDHVQEEFVAADQRARQLAATHAEIAAGLTHRAELAESQVAELRGWLSVRDVELAEARTAAGDLGTRLADVESSLADTQSELATARDALGVERDQAAQQLATMRAQAQRADSEHADQVRTLTRRVGDADNRAQELASRLARAETELASARREAERLQGLLQERTDEARAAAAAATATAGTEQPTEPQQQQPASDSTTDQPGRSGTPQRQQPSRRRRSRPGQE